MAQSIQYKELDGWDIDESSARLLVAITKNQGLDELDILNEYGLTANDDGELQNFMYVGSIEGMEVEETKFGYDILSSKVESFDQFNTILENFNFRHLWHFNENKLNLVSEGEWEDDKTSIEILMSVCDRFIVCEVCAITESSYSEESSYEGDDDFEYEE